MKLKIIVDDVVRVGHDLGTNDSYSVKIALLSNPNPVVLQKNEYDSSPMPTKDFLDYVDKCGTKAIGIAVEENIAAGSKAWICDCDDIGDEEEAHSTVEEMSGTVVVKLK